MLEPLSPSTAVSILEAGSASSPPRIDAAEERAAVQRLRRARRRKPVKIQRDEMTELPDHAIRAALTDTSDIVTVRPTIAWPVAATATLRDAILLPESESWSTVQRVDDIMQLFRALCELPKPRAEVLTAEAGQIQTSHGSRHIHSLQQRLAETRSLTTAVLLVLLLCAALEAKAGWAVGMELAEEESILSAESQSTTITENIHNQRLGQRTSLALRCSDLMCGCCQWVGHPMRSSSNVTLALSTPTCPFARTSAGRWTRVQ